MAVAARVRHSVNQSVPNATHFPLALNIIDFDTDNITATANRLTIITAGIYCVIGQVRFAANGVGTRQILIRRNGINYLAIASEDGQKAPGQTTTIIASTLFQLVAGDYLELFVFQDSGAGLDVLTSEPYPGKYYTPVLAAALF